MVDESAGLDVQLHLQDDAGELHREQHGGEGDGKGISAAD
jgi:hypothetical protein